MMRAEEEGTIVYDNAVDPDSFQPMYHYAESDADGYIDPSEYEQPLPREAFTETVKKKSDLAPQSAIVETSYPKPPRRDSFPGFKSVESPPLPPAIDTIPSRRGTRTSTIGLVGLLGLVGLVGTIPSSGPGGGPTVSASSGGAASCLVGTVVWSAARTVPPGYAVADGSPADARLVDTFGEHLPNLIGRYARGGVEPGSVLEASVDATSLGVSIDDPGHAHIDSTGSTVLRDGKYALAHLYT